VVLLIFIGAALLISIKQWPEWLRRAGSAHWPTVTGTIEGGNVSTIRSRGRYFDHTVENATAVISYSYQFEGEYYSGYHTRRFGDEQEAWSWVDAQKGQLVQVSYNPQKPAVSVLRRQTSLDKSA
jgi:hypothetical protein